MAGHAKTRQNYSFHPSTRRKYFRIFASLPLKHVHTTWHRSASIPYQNNTSCKRVYITLTVTRLSTLLTQIFYSTCELKRVKTTARHILWHFTRAANTRFSIKHARALWRFQARHFVKCHKSDFRCFGVLKQRKVRNVLC